jgi:N-acetylglucosaminyldiphosphoundecaprenol N-acetyl-beta-D-mannosaminyltransferase
MGKENVHTTVEIAMSLTTAELPKLQRFDISYISCNALNITTLNFLVANAIDNDEQIIIGNHNLHSMYLFAKTPEFREFYACCTYIHIDGMPLVLLAKFLGLAVERAHRVTYVDWFPHLLSHANERHFRIFYLGSKTKNLQKAQKLIAKAHPAISFDYHDGYFDVKGNQNDVIIRKINDFQPDLLFVGMSMPKQEIWIKNNYSALNAHVTLNCGAVIDYYVGAIRTPPRWMGRIGLEWLYRLIDEPSRLAKRYLIEPFAVLLFIILHQIRKQL